MKQLHFGTAGTPHSCRERTTIEGIRRVKELGLGCLEVEFVRGVRMKEETAKAVNEVRASTGVELSAHGPYYINLNAKEKEKIDASIERILQTARIAKICGASTITFHAGFYLGMEADKTYSVIKSNMRKIVDTLRAEGNNLWIRPETTGKGTQWGSYEEIVKLSAEMDNVMPCVDFAHVHARTNVYNTYDEFRKILTHIENHLGKKALQNMHIHVAGIEYSEKGERHHLNLNDSDLKYKEMLKAWKDFDIKGIVICESPNIEEDAMLLQKEYKKIN
jgi:deoxyribonuclease IV